MRSVILSSCLIAFFAVSEAQAVLTLQFEGNGVGPTIVTDGGALDTDADMGEIALNLATVAGWGGGAFFDIFATDAGTNLGTGELFVTADYDHSGGNVAATPIRVSAASLSDVAGSPIDVFRHTITTTGAGTLTDSAGFFSTAFPEPGPLDSFDFTPPNSYNHELRISPPSALSPFTDTVETTVGLGTFASRLRVANTFTISLVDGQIGGVSTRTIVNPEPVSLLLSTFGASAFGLGYVRRRKSKAKKA